MKTLSLSEKEVENCKKVKIGVFVGETLPHILKNNLISNSTIKELEDFDYCTSNYKGMRFSILRKIDETKSIKENRIIRERTRYYVKPVSTKNGERYLITSEWYEQSFDGYLKFMMTKVKHNNGLIKIINKLLNMTDNDLIDPSFFTQEEFELLKTTNDVKNFPKTAELTKAYQELKLAYKKVEKWMNWIQFNFFTNGETHIVKRPTNQANRFDGYLWGKIYPTKKDHKDKWLAITVGLDGNYYTIKIDTVGLNENSELRINYLKFRGEYYNSKIVINHDKERFSNWDELYLQTEKDINELMKYFYDIKDIKSNNHEYSNLNNSTPLNQILYGPPGTGKTYITRDMSVQIANPSFEIDEKRTGLNEEYKRLIKEGHILFTTFHQSMSYEDFIEGIKPDFNPENSKLSYSIISGIFKRACAQAAYNCYLKASKSGTEERSYDFDDLYDAFISKVNEQIQNKDYLICTTIQGSEVEIFKLTRTGSLKARAKGSIATHVAPLTKENIQKLYDRFGSIDEIKNLNQVKETVEVSPRITEFYAVFKSLKEFEEEFSISSEDSEVKSLVGLGQSEILKKFESGVFNDAASIFGKIAQPVILIVDEINRGNVSGVFGELITLLEEDKRIGRANELSVLLPYSQKDFYVPQNLYMIGTMNTADRSVEALDTALRRRFSFVEMMPNYDVISNLSIEGIDLKELLGKINDRIELLIDRDHKIGHSYFINIDTKEKLADAFNDKIIPLLQEYFFGDYGKIGLVLGKGFVKEEKVGSIQFAKFEYPDSDDFKTSRFNLIKLDRSNIISAILVLMGKVEESPEV